MWPAMSLQTFIPLLGLINYQIKIKYSYAITGGFAAEIQRRMRVHNNFKARLNNFLGISSGWDEYEFDVATSFRRRGKNLGRIGRK